MEVSVEDGLAYARQVMQKFGTETPTFKDFHWFMKLFRGNYLDSTSLTSKVHYLFRGHDDLIQGFRKFVSENHGSTLSPTPPLSVGVNADESGGSSSRDVETKGLSGKSSPPREAERKVQITGRRSPSKEAGIKGPSGILPGNRKASESINFLNTVRKKLKNDGKYREFLEALCKYQAHKDVDHLDKDALNIFSQTPELHIEFSRHLADIIEAKFDKKEDADLVVKRETKKSCQYQEKKKIKNPYQQTLFDFEDEMFAADMTRHHLESAKNAAKDCSENLEKEESQRKSAGDFFTASNLRLIKHLYSGCDEDDDRGYDQVVDEELLHRQPIRASELIFKRLSQKYEDMTEWHEEAKKSWAERIKINHEKARNYELFDEKQKSTSGESAISQEK